MGIAVRHAEPSDYGRVAAVVDEWWGGRSMSAMLPKLFFVHFRDTSFVAEDGRELAGFLEDYDGAGESRVLLVRRLAC